ncbi:MAG: 2-oxoacid:acceptor oxidoreductase family protein [Candidatus Aenigmarchaeota archaeon]|nr:2-oxoacid:acceptor oxidoreductase family protein [Candidatus Aenigmarchaeota archaeon]
MIEVRAHGRGGQGVITVGEILAIAGFKEGKFTQAFPNFGPERRNAPVEAFLRIDSKFINLRTQIYYPDYLLVLDDGLLGLNITKGLKKNGTIVINTKKDIKMSGYTLYRIDAVKIAMETIGRPIVSTAMAGAFAMTGVISLRSIIEAVRERFPPEIIDKNILAVRRAYEECERVS